MPVPAFMYRYAMPYKFHHVRRFMTHPQSRKLRMLDVGAGCDAQSMARRWFPNLEFHGIENFLGKYYEIYRADYDAMDAVHDIDLESADLSTVPDDYYDVVIFTHCIEHITTGPEVVRQLAGKLHPGGVMYIEFPNPRSLRFGGGLNFSIDDSHVALYDYKDVARMALASKLHVVRAGTRRSWPRIFFLTPFGLAYLAWETMAGRLKTCRGLGDAAGTCDFVFCQRPHLETPGT